MAAEGTSHKQSMLCVLRAGQADGLPPCESPLEFVGVSAPSPRVPLQTHPQPTEGPGLGSAALDAAWRLSASQTRAPAPPESPGIKRTFPMMGKNMSTCCSTEGYALCLALLLSLCICCAVRGPEIHARCTVLVRELVDMGLSSSLSFSLSTS